MKKMTYKYGMRLRPIGLGCQPGRWCKFEDSDKAQTGYWTYVWYKFKLTDEELKQYDMDYLGEEK